MEAELIEGVDGIFDVEVDGDVIFSRAVAGRFPEEGEVLAAVRELT